MEEEPKMSKKKVIFVLIKATGMLVGGIACASVVGAVIKNIVPMESLSKYNKAMITIGSGIFGGIAADAGGEYVASAFKSVQVGYEAAMEEFIKAKRKIDDQEKEEVPV